MNRRQESKNLKIAAAQNVKEKEYWMDKLSGELCKTAFPWDHKQTPEGSETTEARTRQAVETTLPATQTAQLMKISGGSEPAMNLVLTTTLFLLLNKYTGSRDIVIGTPIFKQQTGGKYINTVLPLRNRVEGEQTFKEHLLAVRQTISDAVEHQNYPLEILEQQLGREPEAGEEGYPLFDVGVQFENIQETTYLEPYELGQEYTFRKDGDRIGMRIRYDAAKYRKETVERIAVHYIQLLGRALAEVDGKQAQIDYLTEEEQRQLDDHFNAPAVEYPEEQTVHRQFEEQAERTPDRIAVGRPIDQEDIYDRLESDEPLKPEDADKLGTVILKRNPYITVTPLEYRDKNGQERNLNILKTHRYNNVIVDNNQEKLLSMFDGKSTIKAVYHRLKAQEKAAGHRLEFRQNTMSRTDLLEVTVQFNPRPEIHTVESYDDYIKLIRTQYRQHLLQLHGLKEREAEEEEEKAGNAPPFEPPQDPAHQPTLEEILQTAPATAAATENGKPVQVLLLGDTPGTATVGILYLGSYLMRRGIETRTRYTDPSENYETMKRNLEAHLEATRPRIVAISMKWFLYIARVYDQAQIIKEYAQRTGRDITVVVGGNTATIYRNDIIKNEHIDILVKGDGEEPLLKIARGEKEIPNSIIKKDGRLIETPVTYVQDDSNSAEIYLSHLEEQQLTPHASKFGTFYINTHKGCAMNCCYCGGNNKVQRETFCRKTVMRRGVQQVRNDIEAAKPHTATIHFEFDVYDENIEEYIRQIWDGIDLTGHFAIFSTMVQPTETLIEQVSRTFKYVYWDYDICTLSERHRKQLQTQGMVKPQPTDEEILRFLSRCEAYPNIEVRPNMITGLPHQTEEDIEAGEALINRIIHTYDRFGEMHWARLHAQPGASIAEEAEKHGMRTFASTYEDYYKYSRENYSANNENNGNTTVENFNYPYIYYKDDRLNSRVTNFYQETNRKLEQRARERARGKIISETLTYRQLNQRAEKVAEALRAKGIRPGMIVGLKVDRTLDIPVGIMGILKTGSAYMPIDPEFPQGRVDYMMRDSSAAYQLTAEEIAAICDNPQPQSAATAATTTTTGTAAPADPDQPCYVIYTSGTTGKPKGVVLTHRNLVNYVHWYSGAAQLTEEDKTVLTSSFAFDLGYTSLYTSLLKGGELHILPRETYLLAERFLEYIRKKGITHLKMTPSLFSVLTKGANYTPETTATLRQVAIGGEAIDVDDLEKAHKICPHIRLMNHYGPTEATIGCIAVNIDFDRFEEYRKHPVIGRPINNMQVAILNRDRGRLPVGVSGELCIAGVGQAAGYLNRPELTAEKFIRHRGARYYRTGDRAQRRPDGTIHYQGRLDTQVKVRGYRIELGEIESRLRAHQQVEEALVVVKDPPQEKGDKYICAYIVPKGGNQNRTKAKDTPPQELKKEAKHQIETLLAGNQKQLKEAPEAVAYQTGTETVSVRELDRRAQRTAAEINAQYDDANSLTERERTRYKRQMLLHDWGIESQEKLKGTTVFVAGAGGGASPTVTQLALAGFGTIVICDYDEVELSNLNRQFLHDESRLGVNKALSAQQTIKRLNPNVNVIPVTEKLTEENVDQWVGGADLIFDMFDGLEAKFMLSRYAVARGIPHLICAMTDLNAYAAVFHPPHNACYHCVFDREKWETIVAGMGNYMEKYEKNPLPVVATSLFMGSSYAVNEAIKIVLGFENPAYATFAYFNQRGTEKLAETQSYKAMTVAFSDHFLENSKEQGFDWEIGWRGRFLEELKMKPNPACPVCAGGTAAIQNNENNRETNPRHRNTEQQTAEEPKQQTAATLITQQIHMPAAVLGALKAGKTVTPLPISADREQLIKMLEDSEARVILTDSSSREQAEKIRDAVNRNIKIIDMSTIDEAGEQSETIPAIPEAVQQRPALIRYVPGTPEEKYIDARQSGETAYRLETVAVPASQAGSDADLRTYLQEHLPDYMIPTHIVPLDRIPLTPNGKVDRKSLPEPDQNTAANKKMPVTEREKKLAEIWAGVLGIDPDDIGVETNFFALGGHSLNATIMVSRIHKELAVKIPLAEVFKNNTIAGQAEYIAAARREAHETIEPIEKKEYYAVSSAQNRLYISQQMTPDTIVYNMPQILELGHTVDRPKLEEIFKRLIQRHETLRTAFELIDGQLVQRVYDTVNFEIAYDTVEKLDSGIMDTFIQPFDLSKAPQLRVRVATEKGNETRNVLMIDMHHIITDGMSQQVLTEEFIQYSNDVHLAPRKTQYKDYAQWHNNRKDGGDMSRQQAYWQKEYEGDQPVLNLPVDYERPETISFAGDSIFYEIGPQDTEALKKISAENETTMFMTILALYTVLLAKICKQEEIVVGTPIAGRRHADLERVIGMFVNVLAMKNNPQPQKTFKQYLQEVKQTTLNAYENQDYPMDELVEKLGGQRIKGRNHIVETHFVYQKAETPPNADAAETENTETPDTPDTGFQFKIAKLDISQVATEMRNHIIMEMQYSTKLFQKKTIEKFIRYQLNLVKAVVEQPDIPIGELDLLSAREKEQILEEHQEENMIFSELEGEDFNEAF